MKTLSECLEAICNEVHPDSVDGKYIDRSKRELLRESGVIISAKLSEAEKACQLAEADIRHLRRLCLFICNSPVLTAPQEHARRIANLANELPPEITLAHLVMYEHMMVRLVRLWRALKLTGFVAGDQTAVEPWMDEVAKLQLFLERVGLYVPPKP